MLIAALALALLVEGAPAAPADGEARLSLGLKDVPAADVLRLLAEVSGRQSVIDADVSCKLTLELKELSWRTALDHVLRACGLGLEEQGSILRVAPLARLADEARQRRQLDEERERSRPASLALFRLSYARAEELAPLLQKLLPPGSSVTYDRRTNSLLVIAR